MAAVTLSVDLGDRSYPIHIGDGLIDTPELWADAIPSKAVVITNETIAPLYAGRVRDALGDRWKADIVLPDGEQFKTLETLQRIYDVLLEQRCDRRVTLVALGGGVVGDMTGFAAATYQRGVNFVQIPTTLLSQVDSSVGGKTGVNHPRGKNMIGAFYQPLSVVADIGALRSLPPREYAAGVAEVIKYGLICDADFDRWLGEHIEDLAERRADTLISAVRRSCANKADVVAEDERESGRRAILNFGHTFGHAIETATNYTRYMHGEAVAIGMLMAADLSVRRGWVELAVLTRLRTMLEKAGLPTKAPEGISVDRFLELMGADKKVLDGALRLILLKQVGDAVISDDTPPDLLRALLSDWLG